MTTYVKKSICWSCGNYTEWKRHCQIGLQKPKNNICNEFKERRLRDNEGRYV